MSEHDIRARLILEAAISPSEDPTKVDEALVNVVGVDSREGRQSSSVARLITEDPKALARIRDQLRDRHIRAAARRQMLLNAAGHSTTLMLNRQAAAASVVAICGSEDESPLGPIYLRIESEKVQDVIDWLTA